MSTLFAAFYRTGGMTGQLGANELRAEFVQRSSLCADARKRDLDYLPRVEFEERSMLAWLRVKEKAAGQVAVSLVR
jgi:hypothetical protein